MEKAVGEEPEAALVGPTCLTPPQAQVLSHQTFDYIDPTLLLPSEPQELLVSMELGGLYNTEEQSLLGAFLSPQSQAGSLSARLDLLELHVAAHANSIDRYRNSFDAIAFRRFFSVSNVKEFAMIFCRKRHYQYPVVHWPTFALEQASLPLLMVISLTGATYSYRPGHGSENITDARNFYHLADSYIFHELKIFVDNLPSGGDLSEAVELCQAALLMYALDTLLASDLDMQQLAVTERLPTLISAMRRLHFIGCRHHPSEDWELFLRREHIIRLVSWAFCADCLATLSCNNPPIFSMLEMSGDLPCDPTLWDIDSVLTFELTKPSPQKTSYCLKELISKLLEENWRADIEWENLPLFHLHMMLCAFQHIIFNLHVAMFLKQQSDKLLQTLDIWRHLWERALERIPNDHRKWLGVAKNVPDIEYLSRRVIEISASPEASSSRYLQRLPSRGARDIHEFIKDFISKK
ncbi:hypothetical protein JX265_001841 [Neoarthrinium moseri]|uniref:Xylanolytic transcriptional activator regulatory domain-containing protein n=1 Tax=Neoarthrinium moseri TaxID=1658444 RepID=A0A9P9WW01_9PEZI|nr:hypothetical protein JX265_001841 [Neoarthrinium moseri]